MNGELELRAGSIRVVVWHDDDPPPGWAWLAAVDTPVFTASGCAETRQDAIENVIAVLDFWKQKSDPEEAKHFDWMRGELAKEL